MKSMLLKLSTFMHQAWNKLNTILHKNDDLLMLISGLGLALLLRLQLRSYISNDAKAFFLPWFDFIQNNNGFWAMKYRFGDYNPPYPYLLVFGVWFQSQVHISRILAIKLISIAFDFLGAYFVAQIIGVKYSKRALRIIGALIFLFLPTVFLNSAMWGQSDVIYTVFSLAMLYFLLIGRNNLAMLAFGLAFSFKLQAIFLVPLLLLLLLMGRLSLRNLLMIPATYFTLLLPALAVGRPLLDLLRIYPIQVGYRYALTMNAPTLYALLDNSAIKLFDPAGMLFAVFAIILGIYAIYKAAPLLNNDLLVTLATASVLFVPYLLPRMHERYFFLAEVFCLLLAFYHPKTFLIPVMMQVVTWSTYRGYFFGQLLFPLSTGALVMLIALIYLAYYLVIEIKESQLRTHIAPSDSK
jgi:Gpi18-like mannosyltransferase